MGRREKERGSGGQGCCLYTAARDCQPEALCSWGYLPFPFCGHPWKVKKSHLRLPWQGKLSSRDPPHTFGQDKLWLLRGIAVGGELFPTESSLPNLEPTEEFFKRSRSLHTFASCDVMGVYCRFNSSQQSQLLSTFPTTSIIFDTAKGGGDEGGTSIVYLGCVTASRGVETFPPLPARRQDRHHAPHSGQPLLTSAHSSMLVSIRFLSVQDCWKNVYVLF